MEGEEIILDRKQLLKKSARALQNPTRQNPLNSLSCLWEIHTAQLCGCDVTNHFNVLGLQGWAAVGEEAGRVAVGRAAGVVSVGFCFWKLSEAFPVSNEAKTIRLQGGPEPISDDGSTFGITQ